MANVGPSARPDNASAPSPTVVAARLGFAIILVATFAWGIWISSEPDGAVAGPNRAGAARALAPGELELIAMRPMPAVWDFLSVAATPIGFAFLLLVRVESLRPTMRARAIANAGSAAAVAVAVSGLGTGLWWAAGLASGATWGALALAATPLGVGGTLFVSAAALRDREWARGLRPYALAGGLAMVVAGVAMGIRVGFEPLPYAPISASVLAAAWPAGVGLLLLVASEEVRGSPRLSSAGVALGGLLAAAALTAAIWFAVDVYQVLRETFGDADRFLSLVVQLAILPMSVALLGGVVAFGLRGREVWAAAPALGWTASVLVATAAVGFAAKLIADADGLPWALMGVLITPLAIAATIAVEAQRCRQLRA